MKDALSQLRSDIDRIDAEVVDLLNRRARLAQQIGEVKKANHEPLYSPQRERSVLDRLKSINKGPTSGLALDRIYREVMASALSLEHVQSCITGGLNEAEARDALQYIAGNDCSYEAASSPADLVSRFGDGSRSFILVSAIWRKEIDELVSGPSSVCRWSGCMNLSNGNLHELIHLYRRSGDPVEHNRPSRAVIVPDSVSSLNAVIDALSSLPVEYAECVPGSDAGIIVAQFTIPVRDWTEAQRNAWASCPATFLVFG